MDQCREFLRDQAVTFRVQVTVLFGRHGSHEGVLNRLGTHLEGFESLHHKSRRNLRCGLIELLGDMVAQRGG